ncbi:MAG TPA: LLM class flavin-dependent oxidoreductase [Thermomicrobiales bacterium]|nr:LLM class flavin-dependent oxidoreductase [Thermomicrobiales bacterium]
MGRGFGIISTTRPEVIEQVAAEAERLGYSSFWANDIPGGDGLAALAAAAGATTSIRLASGVLGVRRHAPEGIARGVERLRLPVERLTIGLGTGGAERPLRAVRAGVEGLKRLLDVPVIIAATGPKMRVLAGEVADGALFNWPSPMTAAAARDIVLDAAQRAGRPQPSVSAYVRCALMPQAEAAMEAEIDQYARHGPYADQLAAAGLTARDAVVRGADAAGLQSGIAAFEPILDEVVVRAITADEEPTSLLELLRACAPPG